MLEEYLPHSKHTSEEKIRLINIFKSFLEIQVKYIYLKYILYRFLKYGTSLNCHYGRDRNVLGQRTQWVGSLPCLW